MLQTLCKNGVYIIGENPSVDFSWSGFNKVNILIDKFLVTKVSFVKKRTPVTKLPESQEKAIYSWVMVISWRFHSCHSLHLYAIGRIRLILDLVLCWSSTLGEKLGRSSMFCNRIFDQIRVQNFGGVLMLKIVNPGRPT